MIQESGRSMIEMIGVLAIMGVITSAAILLISSAMNMQKLQETKEEVIGMVLNIRSKFSEFDDFSNINNSSMQGLTGMNSNKNPYGGTYKISVDPSNARQFIISIDGLSKSECESLSVEAWSGSVGYEMSNRTESGAVGDCDNANGENVVQITYGE